MILCQRQGHRARQRYGPEKEMDSAIERRNREVGERKNNEGEKKGRENDKINQTLKLNIK